MVAAPASVAALFQRLVIRGGAEGLVLHASDGRTFKVKPEISIDAAGFACRENVSRSSVN
jgi:hypothetical protein